MTASLVSLVAYHVLFDDAENRAAVRIAVRDSSRAEDRAGGKRPCFRRMHDQRRKIESHVIAGGRFSEDFAIDEGEQRQV